MKHNFLKNEFIHVQKFEQTNMILKDTSFGTMELL